MLGEENAALQGVHREGLLRNCAEGQLYLDLAGEVIAHQLNIGDPLTQEND